MPAPAVYVVAVVGTVAAGFAFKHFVYDPHIAPKVDQWKHEFVARRDARRRRRAGPTPVPVAVQLNRSPRDDKRSDDSETDDDNDQKTTIELDNMESEVLDWRNEVERVGTLRQRKPKGPDSVTSTSASSTSFAMPPPPPPANSLPTDEPHILFDSSSESSPMTSAAPTRGTTPSPISPQVSSLTSFPSRSTLSSPPHAYAQLVDIEPPTPVSTIFNDNDNSATIAPAASTSASTSSFSSPRHVPSLSLLHPVDLDHEHDVELLSAPSSRPDSPFSALSQPSSTGGFSLTAGSEENQRTQSLPPPGISQLLIPSPSMSHSGTLSASFYETPNASPIPSRTSSELDSMDAESVRSLTFSTSESESEFEDGSGVRERTESEFGGSEVDFGSESSWASVSDGSENGNRRR